MLRLAEPDGVYEVPVTIAVPADGGPEERTFTAHFRLASPEAANTAMQQGDAAYLKLVLVGWSGVSDHDGAPVEFSAENLDRLAGIPYFSLGVSRAFERFALGLPGKTLAPSDDGSLPAAAATRSRKTRGRSAST